MSELSGEILLRVVFGGADDGRVVSDPEGDPDGTWGTAAASFSQDAAVRDVLSTAIAACIPGAVSHIEVGTIAVEDWPMVTAEYRVTIVSGGATPTEFIADAVDAITRQQLTEMINSGMTQAGLDYRVVVHSLVRG